MNKEKIENIRKAMHACMPTEINTEDIDELCDDADMLPEKAMELSRVHSDFVNLKYSTDRDRVKLAEAEKDARQARAYLDELQWHRKQSEKNVEAIISFLK